MEKIGTKEKIKSWLFDWLDTIIIAIIAVVFIFTVFFRVATIKGESMQNTFFENEKVIISKLFYEPEYGDVIVASRNYDNSIEMGTYKEPVIKRVIAIGGQYVDIDFEEGDVYVGYDLSNMKKLDEPYVKMPTYRKGNVEFPLYVPDGYVFVLGDNRSESLDSRFSDIGLVDEKNILGKVIYRIYPFDKIGSVKTDE